MLWAAPQEPGQGLETDLGLNFSFLICVCVFMRLCVCNCVCVPVSAPCTCVRACLCPRGQVHVCVCVCVPVSVFYGLQTQSSNSFETFSFGRILELLSLFAGERTPKKHPPKQFQTHHVVNKPKEPGV